MSTFDEALHPRQTTGRFAQKRNDAPSAQLMDDIMGPDTIVGNYVNERVAGEPGVTEITAEEFRGGDVIDAPQLKAGDRILWRSVTDDGERYFAETVTHAQAGIDLQYRRVVEVETARRPGGDATIQFRASQRVGVLPAKEDAVAYPELRGGVTPDQLEASVESVSEYGSMVAIHRRNAHPPLDRFHVAQQLTVGRVPLLDADRTVQEKVAERYVPLAGMSLDEELAREPIGHSGRAWND